MLVDGDDMNEPIADAVRSILDGHVVLTRDLAHRGHYPAVDVLQSVSRLAGEVTTPEVGAAARALRSMLAAHRDKEDLISIGAYRVGTDPMVDATLERRDRIDAFLRQDLGDLSAPETADAGLLALTEGIAMPAFAPPAGEAVPPTPGDPGGPAIPPLSLGLS